MHFAVAHSAWTTCKPPLVFNYVFLLCYRITVDFNSLFTEMFQTSEVRCEVQKFIMRFTN